MLNFWFLQNYVVILFVIIFIFTLGILTNIKVPIFGYPRTMTCLTRILILNIMLIFIFDTVNVVNKPLLLYFAQFTITTWTYYVQLFLLIFLICFLSLMLNYITYTELDFEALILVLFSFFGLFLLPASADFIAFFLAIEIYSLPTYILISFKTYSPKSTEAGLKYFILNCFSSALLLFGISSIYFATGCINFNDLHILLFHKWTSYEQILILGICLIVFNFGFKISAVPLHLGTLDAYEGAPLIITAFLNIFPKIPLFTIYFIIFQKCFYYYNYIWSNILFLLSISSVIIASISILFQQKTIRIITYSMITNIGFFIYPLSLNESYITINMFIFQIIYSIIIIGIFSILIALKPIYNDRQYDKVSILINLFRSNPALAVLLATFLFSLGSIPPVAGFFGKYVYFLGLLSFNNVFVSVVFFFFSALPFIVYLRLLKLMFFTSEYYGFQMFRPISFSLAILLSSVFVFNIIILILPLFSFSFLVVWGWLFL